MDSAQRKEVAKWGRDLIISVVLVPAVLAYFNMSPLVMILGGALSLAVLTAWENWAFIQANKKLKSSVEIAFLFIALFALVGSGFWYSSRLKMLAQAKEKSPSSVVTSPVCVTEKEIEQQKKKGRQLLPLSPRDIVNKNLHGGVAVVAIYVGKWVKSCGKFLQVTPDETKTNHVVWVYNEIFNLYFDKSRWDSRLATLKDGQNFSAYCEIESFPPNGWLLANNCELVE